MNNCKGQFLEINDCCDVSCSSSVAESCNECKIATCVSLQQSDSHCLIHYNSTLEQYPNNDCIHQCSCPIGLYRNGDECVPQDQCYCVLANLTEIQPGEEFDIGCYSCRCTGATFVCTKRNECIEEGEWSAWSTWSSCSSTCLSGQVHPQKTRYRSCRSTTSLVDFYKKWITNPTQEFICPGGSQETIPCHSLKTEFEMIRHPPVHDILRFNKEDESILKYNYLARGLRPK